MCNRAHTQLVAVGIDGGSLTRSLDPISIAGQVGAAAAVAAPPTARTGAAAKAKARKEAERIAAETKAAQKAEREVGSLAAHAERTACVHPEGTATSSAPPAHGVSSVLLDWGGPCTPTELGACKRRD